MKRVWEKYRRHLGYLGLAFVISGILFLFLPVSYYLFHTRIFQLVNSRKSTRVQAETIHLKRKDREERRIEKKSRESEKKARSRFVSRFDLDLSVLSYGEGPGTISEDIEHIIEEGEADIPPIKRTYMPPAYPNSARSSGIEGVIKARLLIDERGDVVRVKILTAPRGWGFEEAVTDAVMKWKFEPAKLKNLPVKVWAIQEIEFKL